MDTVESVLQRVNEAIGADREIDEEWIEIIRRLINRKKTLEIVTVDYSVHLFIASLFEDLKTYRFVIDNRPDLDNDEKAIHYWLRQFKWKRSFIQEYHFRSTLDIILQHEDINYRDELQRTPLMVAALSHMDFDLCGVLVEKGADVNLYDLFYNKAFHYNPDILKYAELNSENMTNMFGFTAHTPHPWRCPIHISREGPIADLLVSLYLEADGSPSNIKHAIKKVDASKIIYLDSWGPAFPASEKGLIAFYNFISRYEGKDIFKIMRRTLPIAIKESIISRASSYEKARRLAMLIGADQASIIESETNHVSKEALINLAMRVRNRKP